MADQIGRLVEEIQRLTKHMIDNNEDSSLQEIRTSLMIEKMIKLEKIFEQSNHFLQGEVRRKDKQMRKMKKKMREEQEDNAKQLLKYEKQSRRTSKMERQKKESQKDQQNQNLQKVQRKYESAKQQLSEKKKKIEELEEKVICLQQENKRYSLQNQQQAILIRQLTNTEEDQSHQSSMGRNSNLSTNVTVHGIMSTEENCQFIEENIETQKGDNIQTDDQFNDEESEQSIKEKYCETEVFEEQSEGEEKGKEIEQKGRMEQKEVEKVKKSEKNWMRKIFWFLE